GHAERDCRVEREQQHRDQHGRVPCDVSASSEAAGSAHPALWASRGRSAARDERSGAPDVLEWKKNPGLRCAAPSACPGRWGLPIQFRIFKHFFHPITSNLAMTYGTEPNNYQTFLLR